MCASRWHSTPPCGATIVDSARQLAAVPVATHSAATSRSNSAENAASSRRLAASVSYGVSAASARCSASHTCGWTAAALSERNCIGNAMAWRGVRGKKETGVAQAITITRTDETSHGAYGAELPGADRPAVLTWRALGPLRIADH